MTPKMHGIYKNGKIELTEVSVSFPQGQVVITPEADTKPIAGKLTLDDFPTFSYGGKFYDNRDEIYDRY